jgi:protein-tyrosine phosphatase
MVIIQGEAPHPLSQKVAHINGVDISKQRSRSFVAEDLDRFDKFMQCLMM